MRCFIEQPSPFFSMKDMARAHCELSHNDMITCKHKKQQCYSLINLDWSNSYCFNPFHLDLLVQHIQSHSVSLKRKTPVPSLERDIAC